MAGVGGACRPFGMTLTQSGESVTGVACNRQSQGQVRGSIDSANRLILSGDSASFTKGVGPVVRFESWSTYLDPAGKAMFGTFSIRYLSGVDGSLLGVATC